MSNEEEGSFMKSILKTAAITALIYLVIMLGVLLVVMTKPSETISQPNWSDELIPVVENHGMQETAPASQLQNSVGGSSMQPAEGL